MARGSEFVPWSMGIVAANKPLSTKIIDVVPIEVTLGVDGEISDNTEAYKSSGVDSNGAAYSIENTSGNTVKAEWLPMHGSNRMTAPDVRRGEHVVLYRFGTTDKIFWATLYDDMRLRKLETVIFGVSATQKEADPNNADTMYFVEMSAHKKIIHVHTSKANGEPFEIDIQVNTEIGFIQFQDDTGQFLTVDFAERRFEMYNSDGSHIDMNKKELTMTIPDKIRMVTKAMEIEVDTIKTNAATSSELTTPDNTITATTLHKGDYKIEGKAEITQAVIMGSTCLVKGKLSASGGFAGVGGGTFNGGLTVDNFTSPNKINAPKSW